MKLPATAHPAASGCLSADAKKSLHQRVYAKGRVRGYRGSRPTLTNEKGVSVDVAPEARKRVLGEFAGLFFRP